MSMQNYHDLMRETLEHGIPQLNTRTGIVCNNTVGAQLKFDLRDGFPAITTKRLAFKACKGELLGFFRGYTNASQFRAIDCKVWDGNANDTPAWLSNPARLGTDDLGRVYSSQWTDWADRRVVQTPAERDRLLSLGYQVRMCGESVGEDGLPAKVAQPMVYSSNNCSIPVSNTVDGTWSVNEPEI